MESLGSKITEHRKKLNLTQKELGDKLNVSAQAVSKWENGQAEPDASTLIKLCEIFKISTDELLGITPPADEAAAAAEATAEDIAEAPEPQPQATEQPAAVEQKIINGYCEDCKKPVGPGEYVVTHMGRGMVNQHIYCKECDLKRKKAALRSDYYLQRERTKKSVIWGTVAGVAALALSLIGLLVPTGTSLDFEIGVGEAIAASVVGGISIFAFVMQMFWDGVVNSMFFFFIKSFKMPGVIFTLDLNGIIFLLLVKIGGAILSVILSVLFFLLGLFILPTVSLVILPFASIKRSSDTKRLKAIANI